MVTAGLTARLRAAFFHLQSDWTDMSDFIREVEEEYRRDKAIEAWRRYQNWIIALAIVIVVAAGGWRYWQSQQRAASEAAGARFESAIQLAREGKPQDAEQAFLEIARAGPQGYAVLSRFRDAAEIASRDRPEAVTFYDALSVLKAAGAERASRLALCDLTGQVLRKGLELLGIRMPERM